MTAKLTAPDDPVGRAELGDDQADAGISYGLADASRWENPSCAVHPLAAPREAERQIQDFLLAPDLPRAAELREQAGRAMVVGRCDCGCPTVDLHGPEDLLHGLVTSELACLGGRGVPPGRRLLVAGEPAGKRLYTLVKELAADGVPVLVTCRVLKLARQPYYRWLADPVSDAEWAEAHLANALFDAHRDDPEFGYRFLADEARAAGHSACDRTMWRVCSDNGWWSAFGKRKTRGKKAKVGAPAHDDLVRRQFTADGPNRLCPADLTEHRTRRRQALLCAIKDCFSNRIVGYFIPDRMRSGIVVAALDSAVARRGDVAGCILHSDRGSQLRARKVHRALLRHRMVGSMGQVGSAGANAAMESFFALLQKDVLDRRRWDTRVEMRIAIVTWIERTYHRRRRQDALGRLTPVEYEMIMTPPARQAA